MEMAFWKRVLVFAIGCFIPSVSYPSAADCHTEGQFIRAEIYYYGWDVLTRSRLSLAMVRENSKIQISIRDPSEVGCFVNWLQLDKMKDAATKTLPEDPRLVIDLFRSDRSAVTYYASRFNLLSEDSKRKRAIDESFRQKFIYR